MIWLHTCALIQTSFMLFCLLILEMAFQSFETARITVSVTIIEVWLLIQSQSRALTQRWHAGYAGIYLTKD